MWSYDKKLQYPVKVKNTSPQMAKIIMTQLGGPNCMRDDILVFSEFEADAASAWHC